MQKKAYKKGDTVTLKTLKELQKSEGLEDIETTKGFHTTSGLFINEDMFKYLGKTFKIKDVCLTNDRYDEKIDYVLDIKGEFWYWSEACFKKEKQLELNFEQ